MESGTDLGSRYVAFSFLAGKLDGERQKSWGELFLKHYKASHYEYFHLSVSFSKLG